MRSLLSFALATILLGCSGGSGDTDSVLVDLCMDACAHIHEKNCVQQAAADIGQCPSKCQSAGKDANGVCTDEVAALYACTAKATITCPSDTSFPPKVEGCEEEQSAVTGCNNPGNGCVRSEVNDNICFQFGLSQFFVCSEGAGFDLKCSQVTVDGFCCP